METRFAILKKTSPTTWRGTIPGTASALEAELLPDVDPCRVNGERIGSPVRYLPELTRSPLRLRDVAHRVEVVLENESDEFAGETTLRWSGRTSSALVGCGRPADLPEGALLFVSMKDSAAAAWAEEDAFAAFIEETADDLEAITRAGIPLEEGPALINELALAGLVARAEAMAAFYADEARAARELEKEIMAGELFGCSTVGSQV